MKKVTFIASGGAAIAVAIGIVAAAVTWGGSAASATTSPPPTISSGTPVPQSAFSASDQAMLTRIGATGAITLVGSVGDTAFYSIAGNDGGNCYVSGSASSGGLSGGCMNAGVAVPRVIDQSISEVSPTDGSWKLDTLQGIAADGIAAVGFVDANGDLHTTPVKSNVYRLAGQALTGGPSSELVGLDGRGNRVYTEPFGG
jgi:hypothetical protein